MSAKTFMPGVGIIAVKHDPIVSSPSGIIVEVRERSKYPAYGVVQSIGPGVHEQVTVGCTVIYNMAVMDSVEVLGGKVDLVLEQNILGVIRD